MPANIDLSAITRQAEQMATRAKTAATMQARLASFLQRRLPPEAKRDIGAQYNLSASRISQGLDAKSKPNGVALTGYGRGVNLAEFNAKQNATGLTAVVERNKPPRQIPHGFIATAPNGKRLAFIRDLVAGKRAGRLPMRGLFGASVAEMLRNGDRPDRLADFAQSGASTEAARLLGLE